MKNLIWKIRSSDSVKVYIKAFKLVIECETYCEADADELESDPNIMAEFYEIHEFTFGLDGLSLSIYCNN